MNIPLSKMAKMANFGHSAKVMVRQNDPNGRLCGSTSKRKEKTTRIMALFVFMDSRTI